MDILENPFYILGATNRDDKHRIMDLAEEKSLLADEEIVSDASSILMNPRKRLSAELGWFPGVGPNNVEKVLVRLQKNPDIRGTIKNAHPLILTNLLIASLVRSAKTLDTNEVTKWIIELSEANEEIDIESTMNTINEERTISGFSAITDDQIFQDELNNRKDYYKSAIKDVLDQLSPEIIVKVVTDAIEKTTDIGEKEAPSLIYDLVDSFEVEAQDFLEQETRNIDSLIEQIRVTSNEQNETKLDKLVSKFEQVAKNWDLVAQPMQVSARSRGTKHDLSHEVARNIRKLSVDLFNEYDLLEVSQRLIKLNQEVFAELDSVVEETVEDSETLVEIIEQRAELLRRAKVQESRWRQEITYEKEWGAVFKDKLKISPDGVEWKNIKFPLESISRLRWGGTKHSINGVPTGTSYKIFIGTNRNEALITLSKEKIYLAFIERLWKAVGTRILTQLLEGLRDGKRYHFGAAVVNDFGVELDRHYIFKASERVHCRWTDLVIGNANGSFYIEKQDDRKVSVHLPYQEEDNVHILESAMRIFWKHPSDRLSRLLTQEE